MRRRWTSSSLMHRITRRQKQLRRAGYGRTAYLLRTKRPERCEFRAGDDDLGWLARRIAILGVDFDVHEPPELAEHLREFAGRLMRAAGPSA
jgi:predicted DNA-binding transcriptional regulator YafY